MRRIAPSAQIVAVTAVAVAALAIVVVTSTDEDDPLAAGEARVVQVVDGDTIVLDVAGSRESTRLLGIDTPEVHHPTRPVECYGAEASARLAELAPVGTTVRIERDQEARDHFDRLLAYLYVPAADGTEVFVNHQLVVEGAAVTLPVDPNDAHRARLADAERTARAAGAGLWGRCGGPGVPVDPLGGR